MMFFLFKFVTVWALIIHMCIGQESFSYSGSTGPNNWPGLCQTGKQQSPIALNTNQLVYNMNGNTMAQWASSSTVFSGATFGMTHWALTFNISSDSSYNGFPGPSFQQPTLYQLNVNSSSFLLSNFHFHTPSEHSINGTFGDLELHFVHKDPSGNIAVVGMLFQVNSDSSSTDSFFSQFIMNLPSSNTDLTTQVLGSLTLSTAFDSLLQGSDFYQYIGSLTTPPCSENVTWSVHPTMFPVSTSNFQAMKSLLVDNARPITGSRAVYHQSGVPSSHSISFSQQLIFLLLLFFSKMF